ncbi:hypothetical protein [Arenimonas daejeonensis]|uniref:hypothetical protein n=1 Tax=Arenimonas daejeonensis TaxID=370777 RepID=UPI0011BF30A5|nr:hypothetical protein [Arenimonas daejeonensis]
MVTVHRFGRFVRALGPGWRWTLPGLDQLGQPVCLIGHHLDIPDATGAHAELYYQILDPAQAGEALDRVDAQSATRPATPWPRCRPWPTPPARWPKR